MRNTITLTNEQIEAAYEDAFRISVNMDEAYGVDVSFTTDTIEQFSAAVGGYASYEGEEFGEVDGMRTLLIKQAQPRKGDQRRDIYIIDFGTARAAHQ